MGQMNIAPKRRIDFTEYGAGYVSEAVGHAFSYPEPVLMSERSSEAEAKEYLLNIAEEMMMAGWIVEVELVVGGAADEVILDYAEEKKFDLIVMTTHRRPGVHRWIFGNVTQRVLRHSLIPVLIAPPTGFRNH